MSEDLRAQATEVIAQIQQLVDGAGEWITVTPELLRDWADRLAAPTPEPVGFHMTADKTAFDKADVEAITTIAVAAALKHAAPPPASPDARDAARYRWLRDCGDATWLSLAGRTHKGAKEIDAAIDAAIEREGGASG